MANPTETTTDVPTLFELPPMATEPSPPERGQPVHPFAARFPMMADGDLDDLAADIAEHGLHHAIVLDKDGVLIDGRNRLEACQRAGIAPTYRTLPDGMDPVRYILSENIARRQMNKGQMALVAAIALGDKVDDSDDAEDGRLNFNQPSSRDLSRVLGINHAQIVLAHLICDYAPNLVDSVLSGAIRFDEARKEAAESRRKQRAADAAMARLRVDAPDLAAQVEEEAITLEAATGELDRRVADEMARVRDRSKTVAAMVNWAADLLASTGLRDEYRLAFDPEQTMHPIPVTRERILLAADYLRQLGEEWPDGNGA